MNMIDSLRNEEFVARDDVQYCIQYSTKSPGIRPDYTSVDRGEYGLWFVNVKNSGEG